MFDSWLGSEPEHRVDEKRLADSISFGPPFYSSLPDHAHHLDSLQCPPRALKRAISLGQPYALLHRSMVLFDYIIQVLKKGACAICHSGPNFKNKTKPAPFGRPGWSASRKEIPVATRPPLFQDHLVLESIVDFSIILRLENAIPAGHPAISQPCQAAAGDGSITCRRVGNQARSPCVMA